MTNYFAHDLVSHGQGARQQWRAFSFSCYHHQREPYNQLKRVSVLGLFSEKQPQNRKNLLLFTCGLGALASVHGSMGLYFATSLTWQIL